MTVLTIEAVIAWLTRLIEELKQAVAQVTAMLAQLVAQGQAAAVQLDELSLVWGVSPEDSSLRGAFNPIWRMWWLQQLHENVEHDQGATN
jgi:hypothetical protein